jgi:hypothetical protein
MQIACYAPARNRRNGDGTMQHSRCVALIAVLLSGALVWAQSPFTLERPVVSAFAQPVDRGASGLWQSLQKLKTPA